MKHHANYHQAMRQLPKLGCPACVGSMVEGYILQAGANGLKRLVACSCYAVREAAKEELLARAGIVLKSKVPRNWVGKGYGGRQRDAK